MLMNKQARENMEICYEDSGKHGNSLQGFRKTWKFVMRIKKNIEIQHEDSEKHGNVLRRLKKKMENFFSVFIKRIFILRGKSEIHHA